VGTYPLFNRCADLIFMLDIDEIELLVLNDKVSLTCLLLSLRLVVMVTLNELDEDVEDVEHALLVSFDKSILS